MHDVIIVGGGQAGLAAGSAMLKHGFRPIILEAGPELVGSWPRYYDSLRLFSPVRLNSLPGMPFPGDPDHFPFRDEVVDYLRSYAARLDCEMHTGQRVTSVIADREGYLVQTADGTTFNGAAVVAATGSFDRPNRPALGLDDYTGTVLHTADYQAPHPFAGQRAVVVGAGSSAVQIAVELAEHAEVSLASRTPVSWTGNDQRQLPPWAWKAIESGLRVPIGGLLPSKLPPFVPDVTGTCRLAVERGKPDRREMFSGAKGTELQWADGTREHVDTIILGTGYRPALDYLRPLGVLDRNGNPRQWQCLSTTHPGLGFLGIERQRTLLSSGLGGVGWDACHIARRFRRDLPTRALACCQRAA